MFITIKERLRSRRGFTLVEMLCATVVLLLASSLIALLSRVGLSAYDESVSYSQAQILCQTLTNIASTDLRKCSNPTKADGLTYLDMGRNGKVTYEVDKTNKKLTIYYHKEDEESGLDVLYMKLTPDTTTQTELDPEPLVVPSASYTYGVYADITIGIDSAKNCFDLNVKVYDSTGVKVLSENSMEIRPISGMDVGDLLA